MRRRERNRGAALEEIEAVYRNRFGAFLRTASAIAGDPEAARDVVQEAFATAVRERSTFRGEGSLEGWVWRIVVNAARTRRRDERRASTVDVDAYAASSNGGHADPETRIVRVLLSQLPERQRLVVFLRYFADLDHAAIAEALGIRPGTVAATLNAAHAALKRQLEEVSRD